MLLISMHLIWLRVAFFKVSSYRLEKLCTTFFGGGEIFLFFCISASICSKLCDVMKSFELITNNYSMWVYSLSEKCIRFFQNV